MSTYLVAYIVSDFDYKTAENTENNNVTFRIWARNDALDQVSLNTFFPDIFLKYFFTQ